MLAQCPNTSCLVYSVTDPVFLQRHVQKMLEYFLVVFFILLIHLSVSKDTVSFWRWKPIQRTFSKAFSSQVEKTQCKRKWLSLKVTNGFRRTGVDSEAMLTFISLLHFVSWVIGVLWWSGIRVSCFLHENCLWIPYVTFFILRCLKGFRLKFLVPKTPGNDSDIVPQCVH